MESIRESTILPLRLVFLMWGVFFFEHFFGIDLGIFGILPRTLYGLIGIFAAPLLHGNIFHLLSNTFPLIFLGATLFYFYDRIARQVFLICYFVTNFFVWLFAQPYFHIGASGIIYGIAFFLIFIGLFRKDIKSIIISFVVVLFYGGIFYGIFPNQPGVSWESHLIGGIVGTLTAFNMSKVRNVSS